MEGMSAKEERGTIRGGWYPQKSVSQLREEKYRKSPLSPTKAMEQSHGGRRVN